MKRQRQKCVAKIICKGQTLIHSVHAGKISASAMKTCVVDAFEMARLRSALMRNELPYDDNFEIVTREGRAISFIASSM